MFSKATESLRRHWTEPLKVHKHPKACIPSDEDFSPNDKNSEDCLYLNIYVPGTVQYNVIFTSLNA